MAGINARMGGVISCVFPVPVPEPALPLELTFFPSRLVIDTLPGINSLLSMIQSRRRRDSIILGCVVGFCLILLFSYLTSY